MQSIVKESIRGLRLEANITPQGPLPRPNEMIWRDDSVTSA